jgi:L,D-transpeptidase catalytic domain
MIARGRFGRTAIFLLTLATTLALVPAAAAAVSAPTLAITSVSLTDKTVSFSSSYETGTASIALVVNGEEATRTGVAAGAEGTVAFRLVTPDTATIEAVARDGAESVLGTSTPVVFSGSAYAPKSARVVMTTNRVLPPTYGFLIAAPATTKRMNIYVNDARKWSGAVTVVNGQVKLPAVALRYGPNTVKVLAYNSWGSVLSAKVSVYQLGKSVPSYWRYVLVDKSDYYLYFVDARRVQARYPVAIGMPGAATPTGTFRLWYPQAGGGSWGVIRMNLQRRVSGGFARTVYYIHGTNDPDSIGTMASHGCVRMYNSDVLNLASRLKRYPQRPWTVIRN